MLTHMFPVLYLAHIAPNAPRRPNALADGLRPNGERTYRLGYPIADGACQRTPVHSDRVVMITPLWFADPVGSWLRILSGFYRLGLPVGADEQTRILTRVATAADEMTAVQRTSHERHRQ